MAPPAKASKLKQAQKGRDPELSQRSQRSAQGPAKEKKKKKKAKKTAATGITTDVILEEEADDGDEEEVTARLTLNLRHGASLDLELTLPRTEPVDVSDATSAEVIT